MRVGNVSLLIPEGRELDSGHIALEHGQQFKIRLGNHHYRRRCDVKLSVDGKDVGTYRVDDGQTVTLECSHLDDGKFTFFVADSGQAQVAGVAKISKDDKGLIKAVFQAEKQRPVSPPPPPPVKTVRERLRNAGRPSGQSMGGQHLNCSYSPDRDDLKGSSETDFDEAECKTSLGFSNTMDLKAGMTGLTGKSDQKWRTVTNLEYDASQESTITVRLVAAEPAVRELKAAPRYNPVPASVE